MEIVLKRIAKKNCYTIVRLYILKDEEVERKVHSSWAHPQMKRWFEHTVDGKLLSEENYFCDTLEPTWRNLKGVELQPEEVNVRLGRVSGKKAQKMRGTTAIPKVPIGCSSPCHPGLRNGCRIFRACPILRASASMPATILTIPRAASWWARTG